MSIWLITDWIVLPLICSNFFCSNCNLFFVNFSYALFLILFLNIDIDFLLLWLISAFWRGPSVSRCCLRSRRRRSAREKKRRFIFTFLGDRRIPSFRNHMLFLFFFLFHLRRGTKLQFRYTDLTLLFLQRRWRLMFYLIAIFWRSFIIVFMIITFIDCIF